VVGKEIAVKKYVVRLSAEERDQLDALIRSGKHSAQLLTKARILLKADVSEVGEGWSDSKIVEALDTSISTIERTRRQLVEEGARGRVDPQAFACLGKTAHLRWRGRGKIDRPGLFRTAKGACAVDLTAAGRYGRGIEHR
jgi:hypothetical protein